MQVSNTEIFNTVAIGKMESADFTIDNSAEFFEILSKSIYAYPEWAYIREGITNAWDSHKEAGITKPILVRYVDGVLSIRDYGIGLPHDIETMAKIYVTYGKGTKRDNSKVTGGFGLGCKSPFAVTDTFEVTSHKDGIASLWMVTKANQITGKPSINKVAEFPSEETGVELRIPVSDWQTSSRLKRMVRVCAIPTLFSELTAEDPKDEPQLLETVNYDNMGVLVSENLTNVPYLDTNILIRYGDNVYPMPDYQALLDSMDADEDEKTTFSRLVGFMHNYRSVGYQLIITAPENSVHLQPSREALSISKLTSNTIKELIFDYVEQFINPTKEEMEQYDEIIYQKYCDQSLSGKPLNEIRLSFSAYSPEEARAYVYLEVMEKSKTKNLKNHVLARWFWQHVAPMVGDNQAAKYLYRAYLYRIKRDMKKANTCYRIALAYKHKHLLETLKTLDFPVTKFIKHKGNIVSTYRQCEIISYYHWERVIKTLQTQEIHVFTSKKLLVEEAYGFQGMGIQVRNRNLEWDALHKALTNAGITHESHRPIPTPRSVNKAAKKKVDMDKVLWACPTDLTSMKLEDNLPRNTKGDIYISYGDFYHMKRMFIPSTLKYIVNKYGSRIVIYTDSRVKTRKSYKEATYKEDTAFYQLLRRECLDWMRANRKDVEKLLNTTYNSTYRPNGRSMSQSAYDFIRVHHKALKVKPMSDSPKGKVLLACLRILDEVTGKLPTILFNKNFGKSEDSRIVKAIQYSQTTKIKQYQKLMDSMNAINTSELSEVAEAAIKLIHRELTKDIRNEVH